MLNIPTAGEHRVEFEIKGKYFIQINGKEVYAEPKEEDNNRRTLILNLPAGKVPFEIIQIKTDKRVNNTLGFWISGPNFRNTALHGTGSYLSASTSEEISLDASTPRVFRSFMDVMKNGKRIKRVVHAVNVGSSDKLHYTFELDNEDIPTFNYILDGADILDKTVMVNKKHFQRTLTIKNPNPNQICRLAVGSDIIKTGENRYLIDGSAYYIEVSGATIETGDNQKALVIPASDKVQYSIIW